jgi:hypothetical protein
MEMMKRIEEARERKPSSVHGDHVPYVDFRISGCHAPPKITDSVFLRNIPSGVSWFKHRKELIVTVDSLADVKHPMEIRGMLRMTAYPLPFLEAALVALSHTNETHAGHVSAMWC